MEWIPIVGIISSSTMVVLVVYFVTQGRARRVQAQVEMQSRLIDRFGSAPELVQFLHSPAGREFVAGVQGAPAALTRERLMSGFTRSIVLTSLGCAFVYLNVMWEDDFAIPAAILLFLGIGYMIATFVSYKLSAKLMGDMHREA
ncbi:MAG TPA: hypothetical protein VGF28_10470 [Thermoanaerobaculia bacterium]